MAKMTESKKSNFGKFVGIFLLLAFAVVFAQQAGANVFINGTATPGKIGDQNNRYEGYFTTVDVNESVKADIWENQSGAMVANVSGGNAESVFAQGGATITIRKGTYWKEFWAGTQNIAQYANGTVIIADNDADTVIQTAIDSAPSGSSIEFESGDYNLDTNHTFYRVISFGGREGTGIGGRWNQDSAQDTGVRFVWKGDNSTTPFTVGGTADSVYSCGTNCNGVQGVYLHDFMVIPATADTGEHGILIDGSNETLSDRGVARNIVLRDVVVRKFGSNNILIRGNAFDIRMYDMVSHATNATGVKTASASVVTGINRPGQIYLYSPYLRASGNGIRAAEMRYTHIFGGGITSDDGIKGDHLSIYGTYIEGNDETDGVGIWLTADNNHIAPYIVSKYKELIRIGNGTSTQAQGNYLCPELLQSGTTGINVTGGGKRGTDLCGATGFSLISGNNYEAGDLSRQDDLILHNKGINPSRSNRFWLSGAPLAFGGSFYSEFQFGYEGTQFKFESKDSGGVTNLRMTIPERTDKPLVNSSTSSGSTGLRWRMAIESGTTANRPTGIDIGTQYFDTDLNQPIWYNGTAWVDSSGNGV